MDKKKLRVSTNFNELSRIMASIIHKKFEFMIWQNQDEDRLVIPGTIYSHSLVNNQLTLDFKVDDPSVINTKSKIFLLNPDLKILLRAKVKLLKSKTLRVTVDQKFYLEEKRIKQRIDLSQKEVKARLCRKIDLKDEKKLEQIHIKNISDGGFGFVISTNRAVLFQRGSTVILESIETVDFETPVQGKIVHVTPITNSNPLNNKFDAISNTHVVVGVAFDNPYAEIDTIIQQVEVDFFV